MEWSIMYQQLEQDLCDSLRDRVSYRFTQCNSLIHFCIYVDDQIWFQSQMSDVYYNMLNELLYSRSILTIHDLDQDIDSVVAQTGYISSWDILSYVAQFLNQGIDISLNDENGLIRLLAILDRRVSLHDLNEIKETIDYQPEWLKKFYLLRMQVEHIDVHKSLGNIC